MSTDFSDVMNDGATALADACRPVAIAQPRAWSRRRFGVIVLSGLTYPVVGHAQRSASSVRILVGFPPGGSFDTAARVLADLLTEELGVPVVVETRSGAGGRIAVDALKAAPRDGSVVMLGPDALTGLYPLIYKQLNYDPKKDLAPISQLFSFPYAFIVATHPPARTLADFAQWAKSNPGETSFGHSARGAPPHFLGFKLGETLGVKLFDVPFQGGTSVRTALIGGQVSSIVLPLGGDIVEFHRAGRMRILAITSEQRLAQIPDVPTFAELGYPGMTAVSTNVLYAPGATSASVIESWNKVIRAVLSRPELKHRFEAFSYLPIPSTPQQAAAKASEDLKFWSPVVKATGFMAD